MAEDALPDPLVPPEVDLRDFAYMKLDVMRLRDSELSTIELAEAFRSCVLSWCVAWHQLPAGSLPNDDPTLARMLGWGRDVKGWRKVRAAGGLHGWILCSDGRLYHPVVAEKAKEAWAAKQSQRARTAAARQAREDERRKKAQAQSQALSQPLSQRTEASVTHDVTETKGEREGEREGESFSLRSNESLPLLLGEPPASAASRADPRPSTVDLTADFTIFWQTYPKRVGKGQAEKAYATARRKGASASEILAGAMRYAQARDGQDPQYTRHPATWINGQGWNDEPSPQPKAPHTTRRDDTNDAIRIALAFGKRGLTHDFDDA